MSPTMAITKENDEDGLIESQYHKGVKQLCEKGLNKVPKKYILPIQERPNSNQELHPAKLDNYQNLKLPIIDFAELQGSNRNQVLKSLSQACQQYGFFQLVNHGIPNDVISGMMDASRRFFELPLEERSKYMTGDMNALVRYGTSFNQNKDKVFCWRDFLKLMSYPLSDVLPHWPSSPPDFRKLVATYAKETRYLFLMIIEAILESLSSENNKKKKKTEFEVEEEEDDDDDELMMKNLKDGSQLMMINYFPECPEPDLTLGMPPHSDYGFLTLLLQDEVEGLQIQYEDKWVTVQPIPNAFVINVGDHLEIFSNGKYKSVLHRVKVNSTKSRISVASLHTLPFNCMVRPWSKLIDESNPTKYLDTDFSTFLHYISTREPKNKDFLDSRKLI